VVRKDEFHITNVFKKNKLQSLDAKIVDKVLGFRFKFENQLQYIQKKILNKC
jgi:hypothetical protein